MRNPTTAGSPGQRLCEAFYRTAVAPALAAELAGTAHAAALLGRGSEVLGYDDEMSRDHDWRARVTILLTEQDLAACGGPDEVAARLQHRCPAEFDGVPTAVHVTTIGRRIHQDLRLDVDADWTAADWIGLPEQQLCALTSGPVFHDEIGAAATLERLAHYPPDVWRYLLAAAWWRVHPEANLVGRTGAAGDDLGSAMIAADLVAGFVRLAFLVEGTYAPYSKWLGSAFARLTLAPELGPTLTSILGATNWRHREVALQEAYRILGAACNELCLAPFQEMTSQQLWDRPYPVLWADFPTALLAAIDDPEVQQIARRWPVGVVDRIPALLWAPRDQAAVRALLMTPPG